MKIRNIGSSIQIKIRRYIEYMHGEEKRGFQKGQNIMKTISKKLIGEVKVDIFFKILLDIKLFEQNFSKPFLKKLALEMKERTFAPDETIFKVIH